MAEKGDNRNIDSVYHKVFDKTAKDVYAELGNSDLMTITIGQSTDRDIGESLWIQWITK